MRLSRPASISRRSRFVASFGKYGAPCPGGPDRRRWSPHRTQSQGGAVKALFRKEDSLNPDPSIPVADRTLTSFLAACALSALSFAPRWIFRGEGRAVNVLFLGIARRSSPQPDSHSFPERGGSGWWRTPSGCFFAFLEIASLVVVGPLSWSLPNAPRQIASSGSPGAILPIPAIIFIGDLIKPDK